MAEAGTTETKKRQGFDFNGSAVETLARPATPSLSQNSRPGEERVRHVLQRYDSFSPAAVSQFLLSSPQVTEMLLAAAPCVEEFFGPEARVTLQVLTDQDGDNAVSLFARIQTPLSVREAIAVRKRFNREWWMQQPGALEAALNFEVECI